MHILEKSVLNLEEERVLKVETLNQLFNTSDISGLFGFLINFCSTGCFLVHVGDKESLDLRPSSLMVAFLDDAGTRVFSEALCMLFLKLCSSVMPPVLQGTAERKHSRAAVRGLPVF